MRIKNGYPFKKGCLKPCMGILNVSDQIKNGKYRLSHDKPSTLPFHNRDLFFFLHTNTDARSVLVYLPENLHMSLVNECTLLSCTLLTCYPMLKVTNKEENKAPRKLL